MCVCVCVCWVCGGLQGDGQRSNIPCKKEMKRAQIYMDVYKAHTCRQAGRASRLILHSCRHIHIHKCCLSVHLPASLTHHHFSLSLIRLLFCPRLSLGSPPAPSPPNQLREIYPQTMKHRSFKPCKSNPKC